MGDRSIRGTFDREGLMPFVLRATAILLLAAGALLA